MAGESSCGWSPDEVWRGEEGARSHSTLELDGSQVDPSVVFNETDAMLSEWEYVCFTPKAGMSSPRVTMLTVIGGLPPAYQAVVMENRLQYAYANGYRQVPYPSSSNACRHRNGAASLLPTFLIAPMRPCGHAFRYCELQVMDKNKIPAFTKLPIMLVRDKEGRGGWRVWTLAI
jgi:hypothetical protein